MKKFYGFTLIFVAFLSCMFFCACGNAYKNLKMDFVDINSQAVESVNLIIDDEAETPLDSIRLGVKFSGIKSSNIGNVDINCEQELVSIPKTGIAFSNGTYFFDVVATKPGVGKIKIVHLASKKWAEIDLVVDKKSHNLTATNKKYVVAIPEEEKTVAINPDGLVDLQPVGSTDQIRFALCPDNENVAGVTVNTELVNGSSVIKDLHLQTGLTDGASLFVYPIAVMPGYENAPYINQRVEIVFKKVLTNQNLVVTTDAFHQSALDANQTIFLVANDSGIAGDEENGFYEYDYLPVELKQQLSETEQASLSQKNNFNTSILDFYEYDIKTTNDANISCQRLEDKILIFATGATAAQVEVYLSLVPKNCVGEIEEITKTVYVKGELKPSSVVVKMQNNVIDPNKTQDLLDYYKNSVSGALFQFAPDIAQAYADFKSMRIVVAPEILNVAMVGETGQFGFNNVYEDETFASRITDFSNLAVNARKNIYLMNFCVNRQGQPLKFYYDRWQNKFVSDLITEQTNVYIKYVENTEGTNFTQLPLAMAVATVYTGNLEYLKDISGCTPVQINFNNANGVDAVKVFAGHIERNGDITSIIDYEQDYGSAVATIELDRLEGVDRDNGATPNKGAYVLDVKEVFGQTIGGKQKSIASTSFNVAVDKAGLQLKQYSQGDLLGLGSITGQSNIVFTYDSTGTYSSNAILLLFNAQTEIGQYKIKFEQASGFELTIVCNVREQLYVADVENSLTSSVASLQDYAYNKTVEADKPFFEQNAIDADYIIAANKKVDFEIVLQQKFLDSNIVKAYDFEYEFDGRSFEDYVLTFNKKNANLELMFKRGTKIDGQNCNITIKFIVQVKTYRHLQEADSAALTISRTFFVFEPVEENNLDMYTNGEKSATITRYPNGSLGFYFKEYALLNLEVELKEELKAYIQNTNGLGADGNFAVMGEGNKPVVWQTASGNIPLFAITQQQNFALSVEINGDTMTSELKVEVFATLTQFRREITKRCVINIVQPSISSKIQILSQLDVNEITQSQYLNLQTGQTQMVDAVATASTFNDNILMFAIDGNGNIISSTIKDENTLIYIDNAQKTITINNTLTSLSNISVVVFAKDALQAEITSGLYNELSSYLMRGHSKAFYKFDLIISNGSKLNPYIINDALDFWNIKTGEESANTYYTLMANINLNTSKSADAKTIADFRGNIDSYASFNEDGTVNEQYVYTFFGITLNNNFVNLFSNFRGTIKNVNFVVNYEYNLQTAGSEISYLGVVSQSYGSFENVSLSVAGSSTINNKAYFGGLVAVNYGTINYTYNNIVGVSGAVTLSGTGEVCFGGLVGVNDVSTGSVLFAGEIKGYSAGEEEKMQLNLSYAYLPQTINSGIVFSMILNDSGAMASLNVYSTLNNEESAVGGIAGINKSKILNAYTTGKIEAVNNVGGIVGKNQTELVDFHYEMNGQIILSIAMDQTKQYLLQNLTSSMQIVGNTNVGGIVGYDENGSYYNCHYQILEGDYSAIVGNTNVGGMAGYSKFGKFNFCSVMSYRWDYSKLGTTFASAQIADILGNENVAGFVGYSYSELPYLLESANHNNATTIMFSSVNALIAGQQNIWGLVGGDNATGEARNGNWTVVFNSYFVGKLVLNNNGQLTDLDAKIANDLALFEANTIYNYVYSINVFNNQPKQASYATFEMDSVFDINSAQGKTNWAQNDKLNGGYIYPTIDGKNPIFEQAPTEINAQVVTPVAEGIDGIEFLLHLEYYDFELDTTDENYAIIQNYLAEKYNKHKILGENGILTMSVEPDLNGQDVRIVAESSNTDVVSVVNDNIVVNGVGQATLTFSSALNHSVKCEIYVIVSAPVGNLKISATTNAADDVANSVQNIAKGKSKHYHYVSTSSKEESIQGVGSGNYAYKTNDAIWLDVQVSCTELSAEELNNYISISGVDLQQGKATLNPNTQFSVQVKDFLLDREFKILVTPYTIINYNGNQIKLNVNGSEIQFAIKTFQGPKSVKLSYDEVILYPNETTNITAIIETDLAIENSELDAPTSEADTSIISSITVYKLDGTIDEENEINKQDYAQFIQYVSQEKVQNDGQLVAQKVYYRIVFNQKLNIEEEQKIEFVFDVGGKTAKVEFKIYPQRINYIEIKNYYHEDGNYVVSDLLRPDDEGLIVIDLAPENGYFDYLEITDATGSEEILFTQLDGVGGNRLDSMDATSTLGKGIKLVKIASFSKEHKIYVASFIDNRYSSKLHTIKVAAYDSVGNLLAENQIVIDIKMFPQISLEYVDPHGVHTAAKDLAENDYIYLAKGVPANLFVSTKNSNGGVNFNQEPPQLTLKNGTKDNFAKYFAITEVGGGLYDLEIVSYDENIVGADLIITASTTLTLNNGTTETEHSTLRFKIVQFVVHNISVSSSEVQFGTTQTTTQRTINGEYGVETNLNFYFGKNDISFLNNGTYWATDYVYSNEAYNSAAEGSPLKAIYSILKNLNSNKINDASNSWLKLGMIENGKYNTVGQSISNDDGNIVAEIITSGNSVKLLVNQNDFNLFLSFGTTLKLKTSGGDYRYCWLFEDDTNLTQEDNKTAKFDYVYGLNYINATSFLHPEVIEDAEDFLNMSNLGTTDYILGNDIILENYTPIDKHIASFDGNGRKIIIRSFANFAEEEIFVGLFKQIYEGMIVMNLEVVYDMYSSNSQLGYADRLGYFDASNTNRNIYHELAPTGTNVQYTSALFGGLTPENYGVVSNCQVTGAVAMRATAIENLSTDQSINFNIGGLVGNNYGYITNCDSKLAIAGCANIGGFVYSNMGKIASSSFDASNEFNTGNRTINYALKGDKEVKTLSINSNGYIFAYNAKTASNVTIYGFVGGFAVNNISGSSNIDVAEISMSYVVAGSANTGYSNINGYNNAIAGFVYSNSGNVYDCYTNIDKFSQSGEFSGFVIENNGSISTCYTFVNGGNWTTIHNLFAPHLTTGITDSAEVIISNNIEIYRREKKVEGVALVPYVGRFMQSSYVGFNFGDNVNAVWKIAYNKLPSLVATEQKVALSSVQCSDEYGYYGLRTIAIVKEGDKVTTQLLDNGYGRKDNPVVIYNIETWNYYLTDYTTKYFRIICDIDFAQVFDNPKTSKLTFNGNLQGNNMAIKNIMIYSSDKLEAIGLFKELAGTADATVQNVVANLNLELSSLRASGTQAVGVLAGIIDSFNVYGIKVGYSSNATEGGRIVLGKNAVGGLAGLIRGGFNIDGVSSSVGANSTSIVQSGSYKIYKSSNNRAEKSSNLSEVYYAGSVAGIVDGYLNANYNINQVRDLDNGAFLNIKNITLTEGATVIGDTVGGLVGLITERVALTNARANLTSGNLQGNQYSAGLVGENRGVVKDSSFTSTLENADIFSNSSSVVAGLVGLNLGGLVLNSQANVNIFKTNGSTTVGGIVGRSVNGFVKDCVVSGNFIGYITGGVVGSQIDKMVFENATNKGAIASDCKLDTVIPDETLAYVVNDSEIKHLENVMLDLSTLNYFTDNLDLFYSFEAERNNLISALKYAKVLGLAVGSLQTINGAIYDGYLTNNFITNYGYDRDLKKLVINDASHNIDAVGMIVNANLNGASYSTPFVNIINSVPNISKTFIMYMVGTKLAAFDAWARNSYSNEILAITNEHVLNLTLNAATVELDTEDAESEPKTNITLAAENLKFYIYLNEYLSTAALSLNATYNIYTNATIQPDAVIQYYALSFDYSNIVANADGQQLDISSIYATTDEEGQKTKDLIYSSQGNTMLAAFACWQKIVPEQDPEQPDQPTEPSYSLADVADNYFALNFAVADLFSVTYGFKLIAPVIS